MGSLRRDFKLTMAKIPMSDQLGMLKDQERLVPFIRRVSIDWDFIRGQLLDLSQDDQLFLSSWCQKVNALLQGSLLGLDYEDRLLRLESDKETLHLQVSVLSDQIDAQTGKIQDLEKLLDDKKNVLETTEESLQRELLTRSSLETQKLELLTELSSLRLKQVSLERENYELKEKCGGSGMKSSLSDLNYIDGAPNRNVVWDKPPVPAAMNGGYRSGSPASHLTAEGQRLRLGSGGDHFGQVQMPQRTRTPPANAYRRVDTTSYGGTVPRRSAAAAPLSLSPEQNYTTGNGNKKGTSFSSGNINAIHYNNNSTSGNNNCPSPLLVGSPNPNYFRSLQRGVKNNNSPMRQSSRNNDSTFYPSLPRRQHNYQMSVFCDDFRGLCVDDDRGVVANNTLIMGGGGVNNDGMTAGVVKMACSRRDEDNADHGGGKYGRTSGRKNHRSTSTPNLGSGHLVY